MRFPSRVHWLKLNIVSVRQRGPPAIVDWAWQPRPLLDRSRASPQQRPPFSSSPLLQTFCVTSTPDTRPPARRAPVPTVRLRPAPPLPCPPVLYPPPGHARIASSACPFVPSLPLLASTNTSSPWVREAGRRATGLFRALRAPQLWLTATAVEKRPSTDGLVDNVDPRESTEFEMEELPTYEKPAEPSPVSLKDKIITCFWISVNTLSTLGLIFLSKKQAPRQCCYEKGHR